MFQATDRDAGKHGKIQYSLRGDDADDFVINPETGTVYASRPMDDCVAEKTFQVVAKDNDGKPEGSESAITVTVILVKKKKPAPLPIQRIFFVGFNIIIIVSVDFGQKYTDKPARIKFFFFLTRFANVHEIAPHPADFVHSIFKVCQYFEFFGILPKIKY